MLRSEPELDTDVRVPLSRTRRAIVAVMTASASVPQFAVDARVDLSALASARLAGETISYGDAVMAATARALRAHAELNASFDEDAVIRHAQINLGLAIIGPDGLLVVVVRDADRLALNEIAAERQRLTAAAAAGTLRGEEVVGSTFVVSNLGPAGVPRFQALLVPPSVGILAVGAIEQRLRLVEQVEQYPALTLCLSCDHRAVDGMHAARFLATVVSQLEEPKSLL
jgi:pyruvate/2-oxoglutarate dehydrogenase complex dihydrolipoamide acyltransferase (E2) component